MIGIFAALHFNFPTQNYISLPWPKIIRLNYQPEVLLVSFLGFVAIHGAYVGQQLEPVVRGVYQFHAVLRVILWIVIVHQKFSLVVDAPFFVLVGGEKILAWFTEEYPVIWEQKTNLPREYIANFRVRSSTIFINNRYFTSCKYPYGGLQ